MYEVTILGQLDFIQKRQPTQQYHNNYRNSINISKTVVGMMTLLMGPNESNQLNCR